MSVLIAKIVIGGFIAFAGILAIGKLITEHDEKKGHCDLN